MSAKRQKAWKTTGRRWSAKHGTPAKRCTINLFERTELFFHRYWIIPSMWVKCRAFNVDTPSLRHRNAEPSPIRCRAFGQLVEPKNRFSKSTKALHQKHLFAPSSPIRHHSNAIGTTLFQLWDSTHTTMGRHSCNYGTVLSRKSKERKPTSSP